MLFMYIGWNLTYGVWTYFNLYKVVNMSMSSPVRCTITSHLNELNYEIMIIFGTIPALTLLSFVMIMLMCGPFIIYGLYKSYMEERQQ